jgi:cytoskeletal protein CcmA (bactofilin family)
VAGRVDGEIVSDELVRVMPGGVVKGPIRAEAVLVEGAVDGDIIVAGQIELARTGRVRGDVTGPRVAVAEGAYLKGRLRATAGRIQRYREKRAV